MVARLLIILCAGAWLGRAGAGSFTLDFQHPHGSGSSFTDAITLATVGAATDRDGNPLGFTRNNSGLVGGILSGVTLSAAGLDFAIAPADATHTAVLVLGVPLPTDGSGTVTVTARFGGFDSLDQNFEQTGIAIGLASATSVAGGTLSAFTFHNDTGGGSHINWQMRDAPGNFTDSANNSLPTRITLSAPTTAGGIASGTFVGAATGNLTRLDAAVPNHRLGRADTYAFFIASLASGTGYSGTLTSISFSGPNVVPPAIPEPGTLAMLLGLGGLAGGHCRRARHR